MEDNTQSAAPAAESLTSEVSDTSTTEGQSTEAPKTQAEAKKMLKQLKYKADSKEYSEDLPFEIPEEHAEYMQKQLSLNKAAQKRIQQYGQLETEVKHFVQEMKTDTKGALAKLGIDPRQFAAMMLEEELKLEAMTPEEREKQELRAKLKSLEDERSKEKEEYTKKELERATEVEFARISTSFERAIESSGLPKDPGIVKRMANYMLIGNQLGVKLEPSELVEVVRDEMFAEVQSLVKSLGSDKVEELIGKDVLNQIRKKNVAKAKTTPATAKAGIKDIGATKVKEEKPQERKNFKQFFGI